ncbi:unnamed protein product [Trichogramma brassicae]|uniref:Uncharacterized protein n=1 Tax=Trichogramma brassicae TaxID=86971 RepID=A0A6H5HZ52_9HYME|nr:unnamed protein product [Trichogramma brassicae]
MSSPDDCFFSQCKRSNKANRSSSCFDRVPKLARVVAAESPPNLLQARDRSSARADSIDYSTAADRTTTANDSSGSWAIAAAAETSRRWTMGTAALSYRRARGNSTPARGPGRHGQVALRDLGQVRDTAESRRRSRCKQRRGLDASARHQQESDLAQDLAINGDLGNRVNIDAEDKLGRTPIQWAVANLKHEVFELLANQGADLSKFVYPPECHIHENYDDEADHWEVH